MEKVRRKRVARPVGEDDIITLENVTKSYSTGAPALNGVTLHIKKGEFVFIVGDSGSGKSTLIKLLLRELVPSDGKITVMGQDLGRMRHRNIPKFRRKLGIVFQDFRLLMDRNVYENVAFAQRIIQKSSRDIRKNVPSVLATVGLAGKYKSKIKALSGGEQQRVAIARAIAHRPKVIFADEPTAELDSQTARAVINLFKDLVEKENVTIIMTTHDTGLMSSGDVVYELEDGEIANGRANDKSNTKSGAV